MGLPHNDLTYATCGSVVFPSVSKAGVHLSAFQNANSEMLGHTSPGRFWAKRMASADKGKCNNLMHFVCLSREARASFAKFKLSKPDTLDVGRGPGTRRAGDAN